MKSLPKKVKVHWARDGNEFWIRKYRVLDLVIERIIDNIVKYKLSLNLMLLELDILKKRLTYLYKNINKIKSDGSIIKEMRNKK